MVFNFVFPRSHASPGTNTTKILTPLLKSSFDDPRSPHQPSNNLPEADDSSAEDYGNEAFSASNNDRVNEILIFIFFRLWVLGSEICHIRSHTLNNRLYCLACTSQKLPKHIH